MGSIPTPGIQTAFASLRGPDVDEEQRAPYIVDVLRRADGELAMTFRRQLEPVTAISTRIVSVWAALSLFGGATLVAQRPAAKFEVVSIRPLPPGAPPTMRTQDFSPFQPGGGYVNGDVTLFSLIATAYRVPYPDFRLLGLPEWKAKRYAITAKSSADFTRLYPNANGDQTRLMLRALLEDRFRLRLHTEVRQEVVVRMSLERGGLQIKEVAAPVPPATEGLVNAAVSDRGGRIIAAKATMAGLARALGLFLEQDVIDETGLKSYYDLDLRWTAPLAPDGSRPSPRLGGDGIDLLMSTLKDNLGLRFSRGTGSVEYWVVDHVEQPTEN